MGNTITKNISTSISPTTFVALASVQVDRTDRQWSIDYHLHVTSPDNAAIDDQYAVCIRGLHRSVIEYYSVKITDNNPVVTNHIIANGLFNNNVLIGITMSNASNANEHSRNVQLTIDNLYRCRLDENTDAQYDITDSTFSQNYNIVSINTICTCSSEDLPWLDQRYLKGNAAGAVTLDDGTRQVLVNGVEYGPFVSYTPAGVINENSTHTELATAKSVYNMIKNILKPAYEDVLAYQQSVVAGKLDDSGPSRVPAPYVVTDNTSTSVEIDNLASNTVYIFNQPLTSLIIKNMVSSTLESTIYFKTTGDAFTYLLPQGTYTANIYKFIPNTAYCMCVKNNVVTCDKIIPLVESQNIIFASSQSQSGYIDAPHVYENNSATPIVNTVEPNAVYKFDRCSSITLNNIPSNSLETLVYWTSQGTTSLHLSGDANTTLKITNGSITTFENGVKYVMSIKDGVIIISKLTLV